MKPNDLFRQFLFYFRTQVARNKTSGYTVTKIPSSDPTSGQQYNRQATLGQNEAKGLVNLLSPEPSETYAAELKVQFFQVWRIDLKLVLCYREVQGHAKPKFSW